MELPPGTVTDSGTITALLLLESFTMIPPEGAVPVRVTVPLLAVSPTTVAGLKLINSSTGGLIVSVAVRDTVPRVPVIVRLLIEPTAVVFTVNVAEVFPAAMDTVAGKVAEGELLLSFTTKPLAVAGPLSVTVPVDIAPPVIVLGLRLTD